MYTQSQERKNKIEIIGNVGYLWFDEEVVPAREGEEVSGDIYKYRMLKFKTDSSRGELVQGVIKLKYPSYDMEIAALSNQDAEHSEWREKAKRLADEVIAVIGA